MSRENGSRGRATGEKGRTKDAARCKKVGREVGRKMQQTKKFRWKVRRTRRQAERQTGREAAASDRQNRTVPGGVRKRHSLLIYIRYIRVC